ncbi:MAG: reverse transcriptase/maturase family protein [Prevotellaceae bacterium]|jgi:hypothetical protein|nr:reverse transcriptase/maturase family protein [Prevotellaceae bacterium]
MERYALMEDLLMAYYEARKHKRNTHNQLCFELSLEAEITSLTSEILERCYELRPSIAFIIDDPVKREIFAADFRDRVVHHLIFNYLNPILDAQFIDDSYSCRKGKGTHYGIQQMAGFMQECSGNYTKDCYVLKLDIKGYFMSMNKYLLKAKLFRLIENGRLKIENESLHNHFQLITYLLDKVIFNDPRMNCIIRGRKSDWEGLPPSKSLFHSAEGCGLPIGNLTSQLFSNVYLHDFDLFVKNVLGVKYYGRYVDDFVLIHRDKTFLLDMIGKIRQYLLEHSALTLHPNKIYLQHYSKGFAFLGAYIKPYRIYIGNRTKKKFLLILRNVGVENIQPQNRAKYLSPLQIRAVLNSYLGIMGHYKTYNIRRKALLNKNHLFFRYGYLEGGLKKFILTKNILYGNNFR